MKTTKKHSAKPDSKIKQLDLAALTAVTGGGLSGPDTPGVMEPYNVKHLDEFESMQQC